MCHAISRGVFDAKQNELCHSAFEAEKKKIEILMDDLKSTLEIAQNNKEIIEKNNEQLVVSINELGNDINEGLKPVIDLKIEEISNLLRERELWVTMYANDSKMKKYEERIAELESSKEKVTDKSKGNLKDISEDKLVCFSEIVKQILISWNFLGKNSNVEFDQSIRDFRIEEKIRKSTGKVPEHLLIQLF